MHIEAERAHQLTLALLRLWQPLAKPNLAPILRASFAGQALPSPIGLAAGFDKDGRVPDKMLALGFGFVEVGTLTLNKQSGNPRPRIQRLSDQEALVNHLGFPNLGLAAFSARFARYRRAPMIAVNIGANADSVNYIADYIACLQALESIAPLYIAINISSPNTRDLRELERVDRLGELLDRIQTRNRLVVKLSPDMADGAFRDIAALALEKGLSGLIATNTTINHSYKQGGLSGRPLLRRANQITALLYQAVEGRLPIIGVGGIASGADAYQRIRAGASLVQLYTALIWQGPRLLANMHRDLANYLERDGFSSIAEAVGADYT